MLSRIEEIENRFNDVELLLSSPEVNEDQKRVKELGKEFKELSKMLDVARKYKTCFAQLQSSKELLETETDDEIREMCKEEIVSLSAKFELLESELKNILMPKDPEDSMDVIMEIRAGTGGDEACLFAGDLFRMYQRFCERKGWKFEVNSITEGATGGYREINISISGDDCFGILKFESGAHRVQRVPETEAKGRIHTSAATVVVMPEPDEVEVELNLNDVRIDTFCSSGAGGQSVNTTYSAVRLTHIPTNTVISMQDERSQLKNKDKAFKILRAKLYDLEMEKRHNEQAALRKSLVSSGDRSAKIRTYNYPQSRVTEHRIGLTVYNLPSVMEGDLDEIIEQLRIAENTNRLAEGVKND